MASASNSSLLNLPAELRILILKYALGDLIGSNVTTYHYRETASYKGRDGLRLNASYSAAGHLSLLLTCSQIYNDISTVAFRRTPFVVTDMHTAVTTRLAVLRPWQVEAIRDLTVVVDPRQLNELVHWAQYPFNHPTLKLDKLTVALLRSGPGFQLYNFTMDIVKFLRTLENVKTLRFLQNGANIGGYFRTWYHRLVGLIIKEDHFHRYMKKEGPDVEQTWWEWKYDHECAFVDLEAQPSKPMLEEKEYLLYAQLFVNEVMESMESEEEVTDPVRRRWTGDFASAIIPTPLRGGLLGVSFLESITNADAWQDDRASGPMT